MLSSYTLIEILGQGGMGTVYRAHHQGLGIDVAIKFYNKATLGELGLEALASEARVLSSICHKNVARVYDYFEDQSNGYLVLELISGVTLQDYVEKRGACPFLEAKPLLESLFETISFLHKHNPPIIVRDIKPENVMVVSPREVKLIDFGLARVFDSTTNTKTSLKGFGSEGFAPIEQYGSGPTSPASDVYSACATAIYLLSGQRPPGAVDRVSQGVSLPPLAALNVSVPGDVCSALMQGASIHPHDRLGLEEILGLFVSNQTTAFGSKAPVKSADLPSVKTVFSAVRKAPVVNVVMAVTVFFVVMMGMTIVAMFLSSLVAE